MKRIITDNRIIGIDLLKIVAMLMIIISHLIGQYGIGSGPATISKQHYVISLLGIMTSSAETAMLCALDI